ncbi:hypothetical protein JKP88DRAFT_346917 [Tribonema minus]|uniref:Uncharacterized protein n=1 Tax=Tribonema minus TaxID=303371 RepID=A0A835YNE6_9STRA|nr:hypothetical protein JKP88DRAFT_346917 [Tribonema minus]
MLEQLLLPPPLLPPEQVRRAPPLLLPLLPLLMLLVLVLLLLLPVRRAPPLLLPLVPPVLPPRPLIQRQLRRVLPEWLRHKRGLPLMQLPLPERVRRRTLPVPESMRQDRKLEAAAGAISCWLHVTWAFTSNITGRAIIMAQL